MEKYAGIISIAGLIIIIGLFILLRRSYQKHPDSSKRITAKQAVLSVILAALVLAALILAGSGLLDTLWGYLAPI